MATLQPSYKLSIGSPVLPRLAAVGKFDGKNPALACGTTGHRVVIFSPHTHAEDKRVERRFLNINRQLKSITTSKLIPDNSCDILLVGSPSHVLAYDVEENKDVFLKEVPNGVSSLCSANIKSVEEKLCFIGGNCSIEGYNHEGEEKYWTVAGDWVGALEVCDINGDGKNEIISGSDDNEIRVFLDDGEVMLESKQTDKVTALCYISDRRFAFGLANGTVGVYEWSQGDMTLKWRVKSKHKIVALNVFDINGDGAQEVIIGWENGKLEARKSSNGEVIAKDNFQDGIAAVLKADLRLDGRMQIIAISTDGEIRGYLQSTGVVRTEEAVLEEEERLLAELNQTKQELLCEVRNYEDNFRHLQTGRMKQGEGQLIMIPIDTDINCEWQVDKTNNRLCLQVSTNNSCVVRGVIILADQLFEGESHFVCPKEQAPSISVPLSPKEDIAAELALKVFVGLRNSSVYYLKELDYKLPRFSMYVPLTADQETPKDSPQGHVTFNGGPNATKIESWLDSSFNVQFEKLKGDKLTFSFRSLRDDSLLMICVNKQEIKIRTDSMQLAGDLVQDFSEFANLAELESTAHFPQEMESFKDIVQVVERHNETRLSLAAESAELSGRVKELVVRAEDCRLLGNFTEMKKKYRQLMDQNNELVIEHMKRYNNQQELLDGLKKVNQMIQKAARLRVGSSKMAVISACREAIKKNQLHILSQIIESGKQ
mmetsp:Transcript_48141/g.151053  ORF Transcript_48141/g.151053 Transcript_48141/m.151053 type:complete len:712 (-) Transcript_48141:38-2173(-)